MTIEHPGKIGLGLWDKDSLGTALNDVDRARFDWYYNWQPRPLWDVDLAPEQASYIPMIWDERGVTTLALTNAVLSGATTLLGFNEPDNINQANMTVAQALELWPRLEATGLRLGSPAASQGEVLGADSWLGRFMAGADSAGLRVDFIAVHYYSDDKDVGAFKAWLQAVHAQYRKPIWVTEWALADWNDPDRFTAAEQAAFARAGTEMMDDLSFVERHAWFAAYSGGDGWHINSELFDDRGQLTAVGRVFARFNLEADDPGTVTHHVDAAGDLLGQVFDNDRDIVVASISCTLPRDAEIEILMAADARGTARLTLVGSTADNTIHGNAGANRLSGLGGDDRLIGYDGVDRLLGGTGDDRLSGGLGGDILIGGPGADWLSGGEGADLFDFNSVRETRPGRATWDTVIFERLQGDRIDLSGIDANGSRPGNQAFAWVDAGNLAATFTGVEGQLRFTGWILEGDVDGDGRADFQIKIVGALTASDITL